MMKEETKYQILWGPVNSCT